MKKLLMLLFAATFSVFTANAQYIEQRPLVTVTATASVKAIPDKAIIHVRFNSYANIANVGRRDLLSQVSYENVFNFMTIGSNDIAWSLEELSMVKGNILVSREAILTLNDIAKYLDLLREVVKVPNIEIERVEFRTEKLADYRNDARMLAVEQAQKNADVLAKKLGQTIGKAFSIKENPSLILDCYSLKSDSTHIPPVIDSYLEFPGYLSITSEVVVSFELK